MNSQGIILGMNTEELLNKAIEFYNDYIAREFEDEPQTSAELNGLFPILYSSFDVEDQEDEIDIQVVYLLNEGNYLITISDGINEKNIIENADLEQFIDDMETGTFESLYNYFVDVAREKLAL